MVPILQNQVTIYCGDCREVLRQLAAGSVHTAVTSPPYYALRDYGVAGQLGLEPIPDCHGWATRQPCGECYVCHLMGVFAEVRRVLRDDGTLWLNLGDSFAGYWGKKYAHKPFGKDRTPDASTPPSKPSPDFRRLRIKPKDLIGIPWRVALALQADGWYLRSDVIWSKRNPMPESVTDRPTRAHEYLFLLTKSRRYFYDADAIREAVCASTLKRDRYTRITKRKDGPYAVAHDHETPSHALGRNRRSVWNLATRPYKGAHFAVFPPGLVEPCILAGTSDRGCCPECGKPWERLVEKTAQVATSARGSRFDAGKTGVNEHGRAQAGERYVNRNVGWRRACAHEVEPVPCVVLDPFLGSGTTAAVAEQLGRRSIGIELNSDYCRLAADRFRQGNFLASVRFGECGTFAAKRSVQGSDTNGEAA
jgi:DNA modification methylase